MKKRRSSEEWSQIQKAAWERRRQRQAEHNAKLDAATYSEAFANMDARITAVAQAVQILEGHVKRMEMGLMEQVTFPPQLARPNGNKNEALIKAATQVLEKMYTGQGLGILDYDALKKGIQEAQA